MILIRKERKGEVGGWRSAGFPAEVAVFPQTFMGFN